MEYIKELRCLLKSNFIVSFVKDERDRENMKIGDLLRVKLEIIKKCYVCNNCNNKIYFDINSDREDSEVTCKECNNAQLLKDSEEYEEWLKGRS